MAFFQGKYQKRKNMIYLEGIVYAAMVAAIIFFRGPEQEFIYFQF